MGFIAYQREGYVIRFIVDDCYISVVIELQEQCCDYLIGMYVCGTGIVIP